MTQSEMKTVQHFRLIINNTKPLKKKAHTDQIQPYELYYDGFLYLYLGLCYFSCLNEVYHLTINY